MLAHDGCAPILTLEPHTEVIYKVDAHYNREADGAVRYDDPDLAIDWGAPADLVVLSDKDAQAPSFRDWVNPFREPSA